MTVSGPAHLLGSSPAMALLRRFVEVAAGTDVPVLLQGETGTGKSMVARLIHGTGPRASQPFVAVNCAGVPEALFESEMFGHGRGAFTGATSEREGLMEAAGAGTLFLDEVGELPPSQQAKLLSVLEDGEIRPVGHTRTRPVHFRLVAATARELLADGEARGFRQDLVHRLTVLRFVIPPLRERPEDVERLTGQILKRLARRYQRPGLRLSDEARTFVRGYEWPGNVRELQHLLEGAVILTGGTVLDRRALQAALLPIRGAAPREPR